MTDGSDIVRAADYKNLQEMALDVSDTEIIMKGNCKICMSDHRAEAESEFDKTNSYTAVQKLLEKKGVSIAVKNVRNHLEQHYIAQERRLKVRDYALHLKEYLKVKNDDKEDLIYIRAMLRKEMIETASNGISLSGDSKNKNTELLLKIMQQFFACGEAQRKHEGATHMVEVIMEKLDQLVKAEQQTAPPEFQQRLANVVNTLLDDIEGIK